MQHWHKFALVLQLCMGPLVIDLLVEPLRCRHPRSTWVQDKIDVALFAVGCISYPNTIPFAEGMVSQRRRAKVH